MEIKICGITNVEDALIAQECGADYIGLIFVPSSPRSVSIATARAIKNAVNKSLPVVGVFADQDLSEVNELASSLDLDFVQLHGEEPLDYCKRIKRPRIKVFTLDPLAHDSGRHGASAESNNGKEQAEATIDPLEKSVSAYAQEVDYVLFDKPKSIAPIFDDSWLDAAISRIAHFQLLPPYFFAGGLKIDNVEKVLSKLYPKALDVASGLESKPGKKDKALITKFMQVCNGSCYLEQMETT
jgi:phosphoribosylanthranilate isomerase